ncbi:hypothetical protein KI387_017919, partial [Taxus chinensis]
LGDIRLGQLGKNYAWDTNRPVCQKTVHFGQFGDIHPRQPGQKYARDACDAK